MQCELAPAVIVGLIENCPLATVANIKQRIVPSIPRKVIHENLKYKVFLLLTANSLYATAKQKHCELKNGKGEGKEYKGSELLILSLHHAFNLSHNALDSVVFQKLH